MTESNGTPTYVILGATSGIGGELCRRLHARGANLVLTGRDEEKLKSIADEVDGTTVKADATNQDEVDAAFEKAQSEFGSIDGAVNLAGSFILKPAHLTSDEELTQTISANLNTAFCTVRGAAKAMKDGGSVVLVSSVAGRVGLANHEAVAAAKAGVIGLTMSAAATYLPRGLRFNAVAPGLVQTPLTERVTGSEQSRQASTDLHPMGRLGDPEDIAPAIDYLLGPESSWASGQVFGVDGGLSTLRPMPRRAVRG